MLRKVRNLKLIPQLIFMTVIYALCATLIGAFLFFNIRDIITHKMTTSTQQVFDHIEKELLNYFETIENTCNTINYIPSTQQLLSKKKPDEEYNYYNQVDSFVNSLFFINEHITYVYLALDYRTFSFGTTNINLEDLKIKELEKDETYITHLLPYSNVNLTESQTSSKQGENRNTQLYAVIRRLYNTSDPVSDKYYGNIILVLNRKLFDDICSRYSMANSTRTFIINNHNEIIGQQSIVDPSFENAAISIKLQNIQLDVFNINEEKYVAHMRSIENLNWRIVTFIPSSQYFREIYRISAITFGLFLILSVIMFLFTKFIISNIAIPVKSMLSTMKNVSNGNLKIRNTIELKNEIGELSGYFNTMMDEVCSLTQKIFDNQQKLYEAELANKDAQLLALQTQINPHFLYNTLATIESIASLYNAVEVCEMTRALARIFRYSIREDDFVLVSAEIENLKNYIFIHQIKVKNRFEFVLDVDVNILGCKMIKFILQPVVENAINHGIMKKSKQCKLILKGYKQGDSICFEIHDDGVGIPSDKVEALNRVLAAPVNVMKNNSRQSLGILNVKHRLALCYGSRHRFYIESTPGEGSRVVMEIPFEEGDKI